MRFRKREPFFSVLLDTGLNVLDSLRDRLPDNVDDIKDRVRDTYSTASDRFSRATDALRGEEDSQILGKAVALLVGVGIGVGIGLLIAPASGAETRADISHKVSDSATRLVRALGRGRGAQPGRTANKNGLFGEGLPSLNPKNAGIEKSRTHGCGLGYLLGRNIRYEEDLVDQLFNSSEKRLARILLLLAHFGKEGVPQTVIQKISQETLAEMVGTTRSRVSFFMNRSGSLASLTMAGIRVSRSFVGTKRGLRTGALREDPNQRYYFRVADHPSRIVGIRLPRPFLGI